MGKASKNKSVPRYRYRAAAPTGRPPATVTVYLPPAHLAILEREAEALQMSRSRFLEMLLRRKHGKVSIERGQNVGTYKFKEKDFSENQRFSWVMSKEMKKELEEDILLLGATGVQAWVIRHLLDWIGKTTGFSRDRDGNLS